MRIPHQEVIQILTVIFIKYGFSKEKADICAALFAKASIEGVASHGLDRVPVFLKMVRNKLVFPDKEAELMDAFGFFERWNGHLGPGMLNASICMDRAIKISHEFGIGMIALQNTNHWMRAGNYGWQAAEAGRIGICFTNTKPNMPAWGGREPKIGNNPLVVAIPRKSGHIVLDMAMSQFSYGKMNTFLRDGKEMPFEAGFDQEGKLSKSPAEIIEHELALPIGLWKGAGLSLILDMLATILSGGQATNEVGKSGEEYGLSQVFICLDTKKLGMDAWSDEKLNGIIEDLQTSATFSGSEIRFPGENIPKIRKENMEKGIPVDEQVWEKILGER